MILSANGENMYTLDNVIVTGHHSIYNESKGWIRVDEHPDCIPLYNFEESYLYCLNTDTKVIKIGRHIYSDWDDLDDNDLEKLNRNDKLPLDITLNDIHKYFDTGFEENTQIKCSNGELKTISKLEINDVLEFGEKVCGIVKLDCRDINVPLSEIYINDTVICFTSNNIIISSKIPEENIQMEVLNNTKRPKYLYHILTDTGSFFIQGIQFGDYNKSIEYFL